MASPEFQALQERMAANPPPAMPEALPERRAAIDAAMSKLPTAAGVRCEEDVVGGVPCWRCTPEGDGPFPVLVYFHGGGYRIGSAIAWRAYGSHLAQQCGAVVLLADYALAPERPFPAAIDDAVAVYSAVLDSGVAPGRVMVGGDSAGGGLAAGLLFALRDRGLAQPAGAICLSPWADLRNGAESFRTNAGLDKLFGLPQATEASQLYLQGHSREDPLVSPVLGDWTGLAPLLIQVGDRESLMDDSFALCHAARRAGVDVLFEVWAEMPHVWQTQYPAFPEAVQAVEHVAAFFRSRTAA